MNLLTTIPYSAGALLCITGGLVLLKKRLAAYTRPFLFLVLVNLTGMLAIVFETGQSTSLWRLGYILLFFHTAFLPSAWYWLAGRWGLDRKEPQKWHVLITRLFFVVSAVLFGYLWATHGIDIALVNGHWVLDLKNLRIWIAAFMILAVTAGAYAIEVCYRSSLGLSRERIKRSFFPLLAYAIGLLGAATVMILYGRVSDLILTVTFVLFALVSLPVARHYILFDPAGDGIILTPRGIYSSLVVVLFGVYFLIIGGIGELLVKYNLDEGMFFSLVILILIVVTFMILVVSQTLRSRYRINVATTTLFREKSPYAAEWKEFAEEVSVTLELDAIYARTSELLHRLLKVDHCLFVIKEPEPSENYTLYCGTGIDRGVPGEQLDRLSDWLYRFGHPVEISTLKEKAPDEAGQLERLETSAPFSVSLLVPFIARQQSLGFWGIGVHGSGRPLTSQEIGFIEAAANPVGLTILAARMTDELLVSREMETFHRFSSFVLHDLKNSVAMLSMLLQNAEEHMSNPEFQKDALLTIAAAVARQQRIISRLTEKETNDKLALETIGLAELVRETVTRIRLGTIKNIRLTVTVDEDVRVIVDPEKIGSVFDNLVMNAIDAMPDGGALEIRSIPGAKSGLVAISFKDSGVGMEQEFIATRLYKPFSSTKPHGLGIGMYQSREIIKAHQGRLEVASVPGEGTEFMIYLPGVG